MTAGASAGSPPADLVRAGRRCRPAAGTVGPPAPTSSSLRPSGATPRPPPPGGRSPPSAGGPPMRPTWSSSGPKGRPSPRVWTGAPSRRRACPASPGCSSWRSWLRTSSTTPSPPTRPGSPSGPTARSSASRRCRGTRSAPASSSPSRATSGSPPRTPGSRCANRRSVSSRPRRHRRPRRGRRVRPGDRDLRDRALGGRGRGRTHRARAGRRPPAERLAAAVEHLVAAVLANPAAAVRATEGPAARGGAAQPGGAAGGRASRSGRTPAGARPGRAAAGVPDVGGVPGAAVGARRDGEGIRVSGHSPWMTARSFTRDRSVAQRKLARARGGASCVTPGPTAAGSLVFLALVILDALFVVVSTPLLFKPDHRRRRHARQPPGRRRPGDRHRRARGRRRLAGLGAALLLVPDRRGADLRPAHPGLRARAPPAGRLLHARADRRPGLAAQQRRDRRPAGVHLHAVGRRLQRRLARARRRHDALTSPGRSRSRRCCCCRCSSAGPARRRPAADCSPASRCS